MRNFSRFTIRLEVSITVFLVLLLIFVPATTEAGSLAEAGGNQNQNQTQGQNQAVQHIRDHAIQINEMSDLDPLVGRASGSRLVLLGEASHGTSEYYTWRAEISRRLIQEHGFDFIIVEGDWPLAFRVNKHVKHLEPEPSGSREVMRYFSRWPQWMWGNEEVLELIRWMHEYNSNRPQEHRAGFYGMDIYAYNEGIGDVIAFLEDRDPSQARQARNSYACFTRHRDIQAYLQMVHRTGQHCGSDMEAVQDLLEENREEWVDADSLMFVLAWQASRMVTQAERHIRGNLVHGPASWNHRVDHFFDAARNLLDLYGKQSKGIVWAHNTHIGDARATDMSQAGMKNIGQIAREELGSGHVYAIGFGTYRGEVLAARQWEGPMQRMQIPAAVPGSYEYLMQQAGISPMLLLFDDPQEHQALKQPRGNRAVGVVYQPEGDAERNFVTTVMPRRYDAFIFFEETKALTPLK